MESDMSFKCSSQDPLVTFGVLADVQYADHDDKPARYDPSMMRYYRNALNQVRRAYDHWSRVPGLGFVLQLGDLIDEHNGGCHRGLDRVLEAMGPLPSYHTVGNHELYNCDRKDLARKYLQHRHTELPLDGGGPVFYYSFTPRPGVRLISLDCFDVSVLGRNPQEPQRRMAAELLAHAHGTWDEECWEQTGELTGLDQRFIDSNGALSDAQLRWLDAELTRADALGEVAVVFGHLAISPASAGADCLLWNYAEVMGLFDAHPCVALYLCGHTHRCGYAVDTKGVHYMALAGIIETAPEQEAFSTVSVFPDRIEVLGSGREETRTLWLRTALGVGAGPEDLTTALSAPVVRVSV